MQKIEKNVDYVAQGLISHSILCKNGYAKIKMSKDVKKYISVWEHWEVIEK